MIPTDTLDKLEEVFLSLSALGAELDPDDWELPTDCPGWTVKDHLSHLIGTERMMEGLPPAPPSEGEVPGYVRNPIGEANEREVDARRDRTGAEVLAEWDELVARRLATLRGADDAYFDREMMTPTGPGTLADFLHIRVMDCYVHEQDMRRAVARAGHLDGPVAEHAIDRLIRTLPIVVGKRAATPEGATVVVRLTGPVTRSIPVTVTGGRAGVDESFAGDALTTVELDSEAFLVLATGRQDADDLAERWSAQGDEDLGRAVVTQLNMMI